MFSVLCAQSWVSGGWVSQRVHSLYILHILFASCTAFLLYTSYVCVIFNAVMSEGKRHSYVLSFAHCVRANSVWSGDRAVQSPGPALTPCHTMSLWTAAEAVGLALLSTSGLKCLQSGQC